MTLTFVNEDCLMFVSDVETEGSRTPVLVHWTGHDFPPTPAQVQRIASYEGQHPEVAEVWFVYPEDLQESMSALQDLDEYRARTSEKNPLAHRFFSVAIKGDWTEVSTPGADEVAVDAAVVGAVREDGMRQIFRDSDAIAVSSAGYHFEHPGGKHSEYFLRTAHAVARTQHAYFVAACILPLVDISDRARLWADTAGILPALSALRDLIQRLSSTSLTITTDSFGGHGGRASLRATPGRDVVFISSSTSGTLGATLVEEKKASKDRLVTLYLLSASKPDDIEGAVVCDLADRAPNPIRSRRTARIEPQSTSPAAECNACKLGHGVTVLTGDGFFPSAAELRLRMPSFTDRPLTEGKETVKGRLDAFDGANFFDDFYALNVVRPRALGRPDDLTTTIAHLFTDEAKTQHVRDHLAKTLDQLRDPDKPIMAIRALPDEDARALAQFAADLALPGAVKHANDVWTPPGYEPSLEDLPAGSTVLVCAGVIASGRKILSVNRELRSLPDGVATSYFIGVAHPDVTGWDIFQRTLGVRSAQDTNGLGVGWLVPRELRLPGVSNAWDRELSVLGKVDSWLAETGAAADLSDAIQARYTALSGLTPTNLFAGAGAEAIWPLNRRFALWTRDWKEHPRTAELDAAPTHAEVMITVAHLMFESRRSSGSLDHVRGTTRRHGYALNPALFDRFNDPMLQAAILRCAEPGELDYGASIEPSRMFADIVLYALENVAEQGGDSSYEFLLALVAPLASDGSSGVILEPSTLTALLAGAESAGGSNFERFPPRVRALLLYLRGNKTA